MAMEVTVAVVGDEVEVVVVAGSLHPTRHLLVVVDGKPDDVPTIIPRSSMKRTLSDDKGRHDA